MYKSIPKFEKYDTIEETKKLKLFSNFYLPIEFITDTYIEQKIEKKNYQPEEAKQILTQNLERQLSEEVGENAQVVNKQINENEEADGIEIEVIYEVLENIGTKEKILF